ncbi:hypothetical protein LCGC14_2242310 [marine sediment metagenome]|uniref:Uncharacterized protein n=1 Tax=marine sediment metagenome TaxID=412755 RepID=A0A0F9FHN3_9ZZZZ
MATGFKVGDRIIAIEDCPGNSLIKGEKYTLKDSHGGLSAGGCTCPGKWKKEENDMTKKIWEVIIVDKNTDEIILREIVIDGDEKSACSKLSIKFATKLKDILFDNLSYVTKELGSYESKKKDK